MAFHFVGSSCNSTPSGCCGSRDASCPNNHSANNPTRRDTRNNLRFTPHFINVFLEQFGIQELIVMLSPCRKCAQTLFRVEHLMNSLKGNRDFGDVRDAPYPPSHPTHDDAFEKWSESSITSATEMVRTLTSKGELNMPAPHDGECAPDCLCLRGRYGLANMHRLLHYYGRLVLRSGPKPGARNNMITSVQAWENTVQRQRASPILWTPGTLTAGSDVSLHWCVASTVVDFLQEGEPDDLILVLPSAIGRPDLLDFRHPAQWCDLSHLYRDILNGRIPQLSRTRTDWRIWTKQERLKPFYYHPTPADPRALCPTLQCEDSVGSTQEDSCSQEHSQEPIPISQQSTFDSRGSSPMPLPPAQKPDTPVGVGQKRARDVDDNKGCESHHTTQPKAKKTEAQKRQERKKAWRKLKEKGFC